jgi:hypothetical protein
MWMIEEDDNDDDRGRKIMMMIEEDDNDDDRGR